MNNSLKIAVVAFLSITAFSCSSDNAVNVPLFSNGGTLVNAQPIESQRLQLFNGVYDVIEGSDQLGKLAVIKQSGKKLSIFSGKNAALFVLQSGRIDSTVIFEGYWRNTQSQDIGLARFEIPANQGGSAVLRGTAPTVSFIIRGAIGDNTAEPDIPIVLQYNRPLKDTSFVILGHRGGGRNSDQLPESENSLGIIQLAEEFGANGIEIDVRLTRDNVPILYHDENFSPRLVTGEYLIGPVSNYTYAAIRTLGTLKNGERIPTLREALDVVLNATTLSTVWLDIKSPIAITPTVSLQREYRQKAANAGRTLHIYIGLPTEEITDRYKKDHLKDSADVLCELSPDEVRAVNAKVWAPRWTLGPLPQEAQQMRSEGRKTFVWTLDQKEFILPFITDGKIDGILTNYPALVAFEYYALQ